MIVAVTAGVLSLGTAEAALATNVTDSASAAHTAAAVSTTHTAADATESRKGPPPSWAKANRIVENFYTKYIHAKQKHDKREVRHLRNTQLTAKAQFAVAYWQAKHHADPILQSRHLPDNTAGGAIGGVGPAWNGKGDLVNTVIILNYHPNAKHIKVAVDTDSGKIANIY